jgi:hypothetical protein
MTSGSQFEDFARFSVEFATFQMVFLPNFATVRLDKKTSNKPNNPLPYEKKTVSSSRDDPHRRVSDGAGAEDLRKSG